MRIYLIRHGQTDWNIEGKIQGRNDIALNSTGILQAECLAEGMALRPVKKIFSSPQKRAYQTALAIGRRQGVEVTRMDDLREVEFGDWEGLTWKQIEENYPREFAIWCASPERITPPGGESRQDVYRRCGDVMERIISMTDEDAAVVSHGATLAYIVSYLFKKELGSHDEIIVKNASITALDYDKGTGRAVLVESNNISHLGA